MTKDEARKEREVLIKIREDFYAFLDENLHKNSNGVFDFDKDQKLDAKEVYGRFFKLDYQARKLGTLLVEVCEE